MRLDFDAREFLRGLDFADKNVQRGMVTGLNDAANDLARTSAEAAPIDDGDLRGSVEVRPAKARGQTRSISAEVSFGHDAPHAIYMHEMSYNLGPRSSSSPGGTGMSGKSYSVGNKYLERPFKGESETYLQHIADTIRKGLT